MVPRLHCEKPTTLEEALNFIDQRHRDADMEFGPKTDFTFDYKLAKSTLHRFVTIDAKDITMLEAIKRLLGDAPVTLGFEPGKLVFTETPGKK
ncbi:MAG: hypothetical protein WCD79_03435 [Chthoniobacteraceae bacterium]